jgi:hypothetical protein
VQIEAAQNSKKGGGGTLIFNQTTRPRAVNSGAGNAGLAASVSAVPDPETQLDEEVPNQ